MKRYKLENGKMVEDVLHGKYCLWEDMLQESEAQWQDGYDQGFDDGYADGFDLGKQENDFT